MNTIDPTDLVSHPVVPGVIGAVLGLKWVPGKQWWERLYNFVFSVAVVWYVTPAAVAWMSVKTAEGGYVICFVIGLFGLSVARAIYTGIAETKLGEIATGWLSRRS